MKKTSDRGNRRPVIYQMIPRVFANRNTSRIPGGSLEQNGSGHLEDITTGVLDDIRSLGATHVWYTGVIEHAHTPDYTAWGIERHNAHVIKGQAGSPYAITDYYDIDPDVAVSVPDRMAEFEALVNRTHAAGLKVVIDFVPNHVGRQYHSDCAPAGVKDLGDGDRTDWFFEKNNNFYYITRQQFAPVDVDLGVGSEAYVEFPSRATGNDCFTAFPGRNDWYETVKLNYGVDPWNGERHFSPVPDTWLKMLHILRYWAAKGVDAFRCDMAHMVPLEFWQWAIKAVKAHYPHIDFIAEIYDVSLYRPYLDAGFDYLYDKVNLYDTLRGIRCHNVSAAALTSAWQTVDGMAPHMLNFLENHDEQRYASPQYAGDAATVLPSLVAMTAMSTGAVMIYSGQELGEQALDAEGFSGRDGRSTIFDYWCIDKLHRWLYGGTLTAGEQALRDLYSRVLGLVNSRPALRRGRFFDLMYVNGAPGTLNPHRQYAFVRRDPDSDDTVLVVLNFDNAPARANVVIPGHAFDCLDLTPGQYTATDLLDRRRRTVTVQPGAQVAVDIKAHGATMLALKRKNTRTATAQVPKKS